MIQNINFFNFSSPQNEGLNSSYSSSNDVNALFPSPIISPYPTEFDTLSQKEWTIFAEENAEITQLIARLNFLNDNQIEANSDTIEVDSNKNDSITPNLFIFNDPLYSNEFERLWNDDDRNLKNMESTSERALKRRKT